MQRVVNRYVLVILLMGMSQGIAIAQLFSPTVNYGVGDVPYSIFSNDFNGDTFNDLVTANWYSNNVSILINNGDGTFQSEINFTADDSPTDIFASDLDGDNDYDLAVTNSLSDNVSILINLSPPIGCSYAPGDVNNDGGASLLDITPLAYYTVPGLGGDPPVYECDCGIPEGLIYPAADVNGDCSVTLLDITPLAYYTVPGLGGEPPVPCGDCLPEE